MDKPRRHLEYLVTLARTLAIAVTTFTGGVALTVLSTLPACDPSLNRDDDDSTAPGPCEDDSFEPNDSQPEASDVTDELLDASLCPGNEDWWGLAIEPQFGGYMGTTWDPADGSLHLELFDSSGNSLAQAVELSDSPGWLGLNVDGPFSGALRATRTDNGQSPIPYTLNAVLDFCCDE